jgi:hypothetical protein
VRATEEDDSLDEDVPVRGLARALDAIAEAARRAAERAETGDAPGADRALKAVSDALDRAATRLDEARGDLPDPLVRASERRFEQARRRADQARESDKAGAGQATDTPGT